MTTRSAGLTIAPAAYDEATVLVAELDADLLARYGDGAGSVVAHAEQFEPARGGAFLVARLDGADVGCAGLRALGTVHGHDGVAELKRMWVRPAGRRQGLARALLAAVEDAARGLCHRELWLETGTEQPEALALYTGAGYTPVPRFGQYAGAADARHLGRQL